MDPFYGAPTVVVVLADKNMPTCVEGDYIGVGHCILGYAKDEPKPAAPRKEGYVVRV